MQIKKLIHSFEYKLSFSYTNYFSIYNLHLFLLQCTQKSRYEGVKYIVTWLARVTSGGAAAKLYLENVDFMDKYTSFAVVPYII